MKMWGYYTFHTFINSFIKLFRSKFVIVLICSLFIGVIVGGMGGAIGALLIADQMPESEETTEVEEEIEDDEEDDPVDFNGDGIWDEQDIQITCVMIQAAAVLLLIGFLLWGMYSGSRKGSDIFLMADVNFLFTSPKKPQTVLLFRLSFQMFTLIFISACYVYILPGILVALQRQAYVGIAIFMAWILLLFFQKLVSILTYTITSTYTALKKRILPCIYIIVCLVVVVHGAVYLFCGKDWVSMLEKIYGNHAWNWFPIVGWFKGAIQEMLDGRIVFSILWFLLLIAAVLALIWSIWHIKADFYEEAMEGAAIREEQTIAAQEGRKARVNAAEKKPKVRKVREVGELKGQGASIFFYKEMHNRRRSSKLGFLSNMMFTYFLIALIICVIMVYVLKTPNFMVVGLLFLLILFFRNVGNPMAAETSKNWLFLVPESPYRKVFYSLLATALSSALDLLPAVVLAGIMLQESVWMVVLWYVQLLIVDFVFSIAGMFLQSMLPSSSIETVKAMLQMMIKVFVMLFIMGSFFIGYFAVDTWLGLVLSVTVGLVIGIAGFFIYPARLHRGMV